MRRRAKVRRVRCRRLDCLAVRPIYLMRWIITGNSRRYECIEHKDERPTGAELRRQYRDMRASWRSPTPPVAVIANDA